MGRRDESPEEGAAPAKTTLQVGNLTRNVKEAHLKEIFGNFGQVVAVHLAIDKDVDLPKGYGYVDFESRQEAEDALAHMNHGQMDGEVISVEFIHIPSSKNKAPPAKKAAARERSRTPPRKKAAAKKGGASSSSSSAGSSSSSPSPAPRKRK